MMSRISDTPPQQTDLFGHPRGLTFLFTTEMWESFSYFAMRAVLMLYMVKYLFEPTQVESVFGYAAVKDALEFFAGPLSTQALGSNIYGLYTGLLYLTPLIGGLLADRVLGQRATVVVGAVLMSIGQFMLVFESLFFLGLLTLILGNGAFKPNTLTQVGALYAPGDARRDRAFLIVLVGVNVGAFLAPLVSGALGAIGWRYSFASAGVGMLIALVVYLAALPTLPIDELHKAKAAGVKKKPLGPNERRAVLALIMLFLPLTLFWATFEQQGNTIALWADVHTDRTINLLFWSGEIPVTWFVVLNGLMGFVLLLLVIRLCAWQGKHSLEPSSIAKMAIGCFCLALSFLVLAVVAWQAGDGETSWLWLIAVFVLVALGELYVWPTGLSRVVRNRRSRRLGRCQARRLRFEGHREYLNADRGPRGDTRRSVFERRRGAHRHTTSKRNGLRSRRGGVSSHAAGACRHARSHVR
jgi:proton-dependent oligopeptide transporter, POT family